ncbi:hypothetical protein [Paenibacillus lutimineralis]|uniref:Uncharacterized protein n=1 Tax=Paenibacillus lutimineralis TaxID=2707005 RepID=A0A3S9UZ74_9BACL|nr:hypothetical protein [Paenibacillus lutimineralis]AZS15642.1 hypothetical protein EI981_15145 [Paenibacillus lutimineralis]
MALLKESSNWTAYKERYDQVWLELQGCDEEKASKLLDRMDYEVLSVNQKIRHRLRPLNTKLLWIIPVCVISSMSLLYLLVVWVALIVE